MLFQTVASIALLACTASAAAEPKPYPLAKMPVLGMGLSRRDTNGYIPEEEVCGKGATCAEACGSDYLQCASSDNKAHCYNPKEGSKCCNDGNGNSCEEGYYCTHDSALQTWCCPDSMSLSECAKAYQVTGSLETPQPTSTKATSTKATSTSTSSSSTPSTTSAAPTTTSEAPSTTSTPESTVTPEITTPEATPDATPTSQVVNTPSSHSWSGPNNSTIANQPPTTATSTFVVPGGDSTDTPAPAPTSGASTAGVSMSLLFAAAGLMALF